MRRKHKIFYDVIPFDCWYDYEHHKWIHKTDPLVSRPEHKGFTTSRTHYTYKRALREADGILDTVPQEQIVIIYKYFYKHNHRYCREERQ